MTVISEIGGCRIELPKKGEGFQLRLWDGKSDEYGEFVEFPSLDSGILLAERMMVVLSSYGHTFIIHPSDQLVRVQQEGVDFLRVILRESIHQEG
jgi:hypothetical protein